MAALVLCSWLFPSYVMRVSWRLSLEKAARFEIDAGAAAVAVPFRLPRDLASRLQTNNSLRWQRRTRLRVACASYRDFGPREESARNKIPTCVHSPQQLQARGELGRAQSAQASEFVYKHSSMVFNAVLVWRLFSVHHSFSPWRSCDRLLELGEHANHVPRLRVCSPCAGRRQLASNMNEAQARSRGEQEGGKSFGRGQRFGRDIHAGSKHFQ